MHRHKGAGRGDKRHTGVGTRAPITLGSIDIGFDTIDFTVVIGDGVTVSLSPVDIAFDTIDPTVVLGATTVLLSPTDVVFDTVTPSIIVTANDVIEFWIRVNGVDVEGSTFSKEINGNQVLSLSYTLKLNESDYVELMYSVGNVATVLYSLPATSFRPAVPSALLNAKEI